MQKHRTAGENGAADFADELGVSFINLIIRRLSRRLSAEGDYYFGRRGLKIPSRATAIAVYLGHHDGVSIATVADALGYSHQAVANSVAELQKVGCVTVRASEVDLRVREIIVTEEGRAEIKKLTSMLDQIRSVFESIFAETGVDLFAAIRDFEMALDRQSLVERLIDTEPEQTIDK